MGQVLEFKQPKPLKGFIRDELVYPICVRCARVQNLGKPDSYICGGGCMNLHNLAEPTIDLREIDSGMPSDSPYGRPEKEPA